MQEKICDPLQRNQPYKCQQIIFQICWFYKMLQVSLNDDTWIFIFCSKFHPSQIDLSVENSFWFVSCDMFIGVWTCISKHVLATYSRLCDSESHINMNNLHKTATGSSKPLILHLHLFKIHPPCAGNYSYTDHRGCMDPSENSPFYLVEFKTVTCTFNHFFFLCKTNIL